MSFAKNFKSFVTKKLFTPASAKRLSTTANASKSDTLSGLQAQKKEFSHRAKQAFNNNEIEKGRDFARKTVETIELRASMYPSKKYSSQKLDDGHLYELNRWKKIVQEPNTGKKRLSTFTTQPGQFGPNVAYNGEVRVSKEPRAEVERQRSEHAQHYARDKNKNF